MSNNLPICTQFCTNTKHTSQTNTMFFANARYILVKDQLQKCNQRMDKFCMSVEFSFTSETHFFHKYTAHNHNICGSGKVFGNFFSFLDAKNKQFLGVANAKAPKQQVMLQVMLQVHMPSIHLIKWLVDRVRQERKLVCLIFIWVRNHFDLVV